MTSLQVDDVKRELRSGIIHTTCLLLLPPVLQKSFHYMSLLKHLSRAVSEPLKGADVKELASTLTVLANEKIKAEKAAEKGPTKSKGENCSCN